MADQLPNAPLVEAILELHWQMSPHEVTGVPVDPHFKFLLGRFHQAIQSEYPSIEQLPSAAVPEELLDRQVQFRFRTQPSEYPLVQIGPGVLTLNHTRGYDWADFRQRALRAIDCLRSAHPEPDSLRFEQISLRFINTDDFDRDQNAFEYLRDNMKVNVELGKSLFDTSIDPKPVGLRCHFAFPCSSPEGRFDFNGGFGKRNDQDVFLWDLKVESPLRNRSSNDFSDWLNASHAVIESWFFKMVEGPLLARYTNEPSRVG